MRKLAVRLKDIARRFCSEMTVMRNVHAGVRRDHSQSETSKLKKVTHDADHV